MKHLVALLVSSVALAACANSPTDPTESANARRVSLARKALIGTTQLPADKVNPRIASN
jgi:hypothetical protein